jgi:hypothetical protein
VYDVTASPPLSGFCQRTTADLSRDCAVTPTARPARSAPFCG